MEIATALTGLLFALGLAALVATPTLIGVYTEFRARKVHNVKQKASGLPVSFPAPVPFNYPPMFVQQMTRETHRPGIKEA